ncbi:MAG: hypothetical protein ABI435_10570, partial [Pseudolysinimonas sp.]
VDDVEVPCVVGTWNLDVADYAAQSEAYTLGLGLPIVGFAMSGSGKITFAGEGLVATDVVLTTTGTIVAGDTRTPLNQTSAYTGTGDWVEGAGSTIDFANWSNTPGVGEITVDGSSPTIDFTDIPSVGITCTATDLTLKAPDAPLSSLWHR